MKCGKNLLDKPPEVIGKEPGKTGRVLNSPRPSDSECQTEGKQVGGSQLAMERKLARQSSQKAPVS